MVLTDDIFLIVGLVAIGAIVTGIVVIRIGEKLETGVIPYSCVDEADPNNVLQWQDVIARKWDEEGNEIIDTPEEGN